LFLRDFFRTSINAATIGHGTPPSSSRGVTPGPRQAGGRQKLKKTSSKLANIFRLILLYGLCALVSAGALLIGGVHDRVRAFLGLASAGAALLALAVNVLGSRSSWRDLKPGWGFYLPAGLAIVVLLQLVPLPATVRTLLDPATGEHLGSVLKTLGLSAFRPLAWDVPGAVMGLTHYSSFALIVFASVMVCRRRSRAIRFAWVLDVCLLTIAVLSLVNYLSGDDRLWWIYHPVARVGNAISPFVNENHAGGFYLTAGLFHVGLSLTIPPSRKRWAVLCLSIFPVFLCFLARSRGAHLGFFPGLLIVLVGLYKNEHLEREFALKLLAAAVVVVVGLIPSVQVVRDAYGAQGLENIKEDDKLSLWLEGFEVAKEHPVTGVGSGAYRLAVASKTPVERQRSVHHAENLLVQIAVELGLPVLFLLLVISGLVFNRFAKTTIWDPAVCGAVGALSGLFMQNLADFNLEFPGTAFLAAALIGFISTSRKKDDGSKNIRKKRRSRVSDVSYASVERPNEEKADEAAKADEEVKVGSKSEQSETQEPYERSFLRKDAKKKKKSVRLFRLLFLGFTISLGSASGLIAVLWAAPNSLLNATERVEHAIKRGKMEDAHAQVVEALENHPADYYLHYLRGFIQHSLREGEPLKWVNIAISLSGNDPRPHYLASNILADAGAFEQAHNEFANALARRMTLNDSVLDYIAALTKIRLSTKRAERETSFQSMRLAALAASSPGSRTFSPPVPELTLELAQTGWREGFRLFMGSYVTGGFPLEKRLFLGLAKGFIARGLIEPATAVYSRAVRIWPEELKEMLAVPRMLASAGRTGDALYWALRIVEATKKPDAYLSGAGILEKMLDRERAHALLSEALALYPNHVELTLAAASNAAKMKKYQMARVLAERILKKLPNMEPKSRVLFLTILRNIALKEGKTGEARRLDYRIARIRILERELDRAKKRHEP